MDKDKVENVANESEGSVPGGGLEDERYATCLE